MRFLGDPEDVSGTAYEKRFYGRPLGVGRVKVRREDPANQQDGETTGVEKSVVKRTVRVDVNKHTVRGR